MKSIGVQVMPFHSFMVTSQTMLAFGEDLKGIPMIRKIGAPLPFLLLRSIAD